MGRTNRIHWSVVAAGCLLAALIARPAAGREMKLEGERALFPAAGVIGPRQRPAWAARISPDGKRLLYSRPLPGAAPAAAAEADGPRELVLKELDGGKETAIPLGPIERGFETAFTRFNLFDPAGGQLALVQFGPPAAGGRREMEVVLYDVGTGKLTPTGLKGPQTFAKFDRAGKALVVNNGQTASVAPLPGLKPKPLAAPGWVQSLSPAADVAAVYARGDRRDPAAGRKMRLLLWDVAADKQVAEVPTHERNSGLDDVETQWTADGRYLYYSDLENDPADANKRTPVTRVWDAKEHKPAGVIPYARAVGPGPGGTRMVLAREQGGAADAVVHDAATGQALPVGGGPLGLIHAWGNKIVYARPVGGVETVHVAELREEKTGAKE